MVLPVTKIDYARHVYDTPNLKWYQIFKKNVKKVMEFFLIRGFCLLVEFHMEVPMINGVTSFWYYYCCKISQVSQICALTKTKILGKTIFGSPDGSRLSIGTPTQNPPIWNQLLKIIQYCLFFSIGDVLIKSNLVCFLSFRPSSNSVGSVFRKRWTESLNDLNTTIFVK